MSTVTTPSTTDKDWESARRLDKDLKEAAKLMGKEEVRVLVDLYYQIQEHRKASGNAKRAIEKENEPDQVLEWVFDATQTLESDIKKAMDIFTNEYAVSRWMKSIFGVAEVIAAGLMCHIDIRKAPTVGNIWRFAGLDPTSKWEKGQKRPWNASLKRLCWIVGESFMKFHNFKKDDYGCLYAARKEIEQERNLKGAFADQADTSLAEKNFSKTSDAYLWYTGSISADNAKLIIEAPTEKRMGMAKKLSGKPGSGVKMLPPARIQLRSQRYAVKLFLAHLHAVMHQDYYGKPAPKPYVFEKGPNPERHTHLLEPPKLPIKGGKTLKEFFKEK